MSKSRATNPSRDKVKSIRLFLPSAVTGLRLAVFPFLIFSLSNGFLFFGDLLFLVAIGSDLVDGYLARSFGVSSKFGKIFDATVDFLFIGGMFLHFTMVGIYPLWVFLLVSFMIAQFMATAFFLGIVFDPIGKYYGSLLYGAIGLTLLFSGKDAVNLIIFAFVVVTIICVLSRLIFAHKTMLKKIAK